MAQKRAGRKSKLDVIKDNMEQIEKWARAGLREDQIAECLGISSSTFSKYKNEYPELKDVISKARVFLVADLKNVLVERAKGFTYEEKKSYTKRDESGRETTYIEITEKYALPDVAALNSLLQNFDGDWYRDKQTYKLKEQELRLREKLAESREWQ